MLFLFVVSTYLTKYLHWVTDGLWDSFDNGDFSENFDDGNRILCPIKLP